MGEADPAATSLFDRMQAVAGNLLRDLGKERLQITSRNVP